MQLKFLNKLFNNSLNKFCNFLADLMSVSRGLATYILCALLTCCFVLNLPAQQAAGSGGNIESDGSAITTLDRFIQGVFEDGQSNNSFVEIRLAAESQQDDSAENQGIDSISSNEILSDSGDSVDATDSTTTATINRTVDPATPADRTDTGGTGSKLRSLDEISKLALIEDSAALASSFTLIGSDIVGAYKHLSIGDNIRFIKAVNKVIMNTDDPQLKSQGYYWIGRVRMKDGNNKKAGQSFLDGYKQGEESLFGAYNLLGLSESMWALEKHDESCAAAKQLINMASNDDDDDDHIYPSQLSIRAQNNIKKFCAVDA